MFKFAPRCLAMRDGSLRDPEKAPRWAKDCLGSVVERDGNAVFVPGLHPALREFGERILGIADNADDGMMAAAERTYREAQQIKKAWRAAKKATRATRMAERFKKAA